tara:strand:+ start:49 stop:390 length:342 start_codon:yes stop_codon:yes gene_type:complete
MENQMNGITKWLSSKWNLLGMFMLSYFVIGYIFDIVGVSFNNMIVLFVFMYIGNFASYLWGMSKGIMYATTQRPNFIQELEKMNEMIREENTSTSKKCKKKAKKCSSDRCKNC